MATGLIGSDEYSNALQWGETLERPGTAQEVAAAVAAEIEAAQPEIDWRQVVEEIRGS
jgi:hypothetical protein